MKTSKKDEDTVLHLRSLCSPKLVLFCLNAILEVRRGLIYRMIIQQGSIISTKTHSFQDKTNLLTLSYCGIDHMCEHIIDEL